MATIFGTLENVMQWVNENGMHIANDEPVIRRALLGALRCANKTRCTVAKAGLGAN
jgi:hypothetical protein